jgi:hypothetical protein
MLCRNGAVDCVDTLMTDCLKTSALQSAASSQNGTQDAQNGVQRHTLSLDDHAGPTINKPMNAPDKV